MDLGENVTPIADAILVALPPTRRYRCIRR